MLDLSKMIPPPALRGESVSVSYDADGWQKFRHDCEAAFWWTIRYAGYGESAVFWNPVTGRMENACATCGQPLTVPDEAQQRRGWAG